MSYVKLQSSILNSSVWLLPYSARILWIGLLAMAEKDGVVNGSIPGLAKTIGLTREETEEGLRIFMEPDPDSSNQDFEGRRIEKTERGWVVLNYISYRDYLSDCDLKARDAEYSRRYRDRKKIQDLRQIPSDSSDQIRRVRQNQTLDKIKSDQIRSKENKENHPAVPPEKPQSYDAFEESLKRPTPSGSPSGSPHADADAFLKFLENNEFNQLWAERARWTDGNPARNKQTLYTQQTLLLKLTLPEALALLRFTVSKGYDYIALKNLHAALEPSGGPSRQALSTLEPLDSIQQQTSFRELDAALDWMRGLHAPKSDVLAVVIPLPAVIYPERLKRKLLAHSQWVKYFPLCQSPDSISFEIKETVDKFEKLIPFSVSQLIAKNTSIFDMRINF